MDSIHLDGRKAIIEEAMDSGEFFLSGLRQRISGLQSRRDGLKSLLNSLESEERVLRVQHNKVQGALLSQDQRHRQIVRAAHDPGQDQADHQVRPRQGTGVLLQRQQPEEQHRKGQRDKQRPE